MMKKMLIKENLSKDEESKLRDEFTDYCEKDIQLAKLYNKVDSVDVFENKDGKIWYSLTCTNSVEGNDLFDLVDVEPDEWEDWDEEGHVGGVDALFDEESAAEELTRDTDEIIENYDNDDSKYKFTGWDDVERDFDNQITVSSYYYDSGDYWNPPDGEFELDGEFTAYVTYYFTKAETESKEKELSEIYRVALNDPEKQNNSPEFKSKFINDGDYSKFKVEGDVNKSIDNTIDAMRLEPNKLANKYDMSKAFGCSDIFISDYIRDNYKIQWVELASKTGNFKLNESVNSLKECRKHKGNQSTNWYKGFGGYFDIDDEK